MILKGVWKKFQPPFEFLTKMEILKRLFYPSIPLKWYSQWFMIISSGSISVFILKLWKRNVWQEIVTDTKKHPDSLGVFFYGASVIVMLATEKKETHWILQFLHKPRHVLWHCCKIGRLLCVPLGSIIQQTHGTSNLIQARCLLFRCSSDVLNQRSCLRDIRQYLFEL